MQMICFRCDLDENAVLSAWLKKKHHTFFIRNISLSDQQFHKRWAPVFFRHLSRSKNPSLKEAIMKIQVPFKHDVLNQHAWLISTHVERNVNWAWNKLGTNVANVRNFAFKSRKKIEMRDLSSACIIESTAWLFLASEQTCGVVVRFTIQDALAHR